MRNVVLMAALAVLLCACGSRRHEMVFADGASGLPAATKYCVLDAEDRSGHVFEEGEDSIDLDVAMTQALVAELSEANMYALDCAGVYRIQPVITAYEPGSAFGRWLMPGVGSTELDVTSEVADHDGVRVGEIQTHTSVDFGGAFTVGAWETIFGDTAADIVDELRETMELAEK